MRFNERDSVFEVCFPYAIAPSDLASIVDYGPIGETYVWMSGLEVYYSRRVEFSSRRI